MQRREVLLAGLCWPLISLVPDGAARAREASRSAPTPFGEDTVAGLARTLAAAPFKPQAQALPPSLAKIGYDQYRGIRFNPAKALWRDQGLPFQAQFFHRAFLFRDRVDVYAVSGGQATPVVYHPDQFTFDGAPAPTENDLGYAGFRLHSPINRPDYFDEVCAFLGASYFRAVAKGQAYGLSARGLALGSGGPAEEFPVFRAFWLEQPGKGADHAVVHALMDSPSAAGAFRFDIHPGTETVFDVSMRLFPRVALDKAGIAPLTSMFQFDANDRAGIDDYRPAVHDSDGLAMINGRGEQIWRPLQNPSVIQESGFEDTRPRGFGLMQRKRAFADYADSEAHYEKRPSLWVEPVGDWGEGAVHLLELPTGDEFHDNIVAFWRPTQPLAAGREHRFDYRLHWCNDHTWLPQLAAVARTRIGAGPKGSRRVVIDVAGGRLAKVGDGKDVRADVSASKGQVANVVAHPNPEGGGWRIAFELLPGAERSVELRAVLRDGAGPLSETWLYRWTL
ncbi:glucan biosynthesis protein G [Lysobacter niastensis]|uniref:glucan biosynthesis protein n=1 Tax=Lysobacter niastensis TaxID=380629 RepID=UPI002B4ADCB5|nr:glucan biosynthesis protein G [Lysobacter niastensis]